MGSYHSAPAVAVSPLPFFKDRLVHRFGVLLAVLFAGVRGRFAHLSGLYFRLVVFGNRGFLHTLVVGGELLGLGEIVVYGLESALVGVCAVY